MAFDGITIAAMVKELNTSLKGGRINKIAQPESDELLITARGQDGQKRLLLSASPSLPLLYFTSKNRISPLTAPNFCMLLRKHIGSARITDITQPGMERVIQFHLEHLNELGDVCHKILIMELMGKHSNLIFCQEDNTILDSIKHISANMSSVREVLPGRTWFIPHTQDKKDPLTITEEEFFDFVCTKPMAAAKAIYTSLTGFSPLMAEEVCCRAGIDGGFAVNALEENAKLHLFRTFSYLIEDIKNGAFTPNIVYQGDEPKEFSALKLTQYQDLREETYDSISGVLETYYAMKNRITRIRQKSSDLRRVVNTALERNVKKYDLQQKQLKDTDKREKYRIYGELLNTYGYSCQPGDTSLKAVNYYNGEEITIPLDGTLSAGENAKKYFDRYGKLKRTREALEELLVETKEEIDHLESISTALDIALDEADLVQLKEELIEYGYIRRKGPTGKKQKITSHPFHYRSSEGFDIYVGKNNFQNEELSFKFASGNDWWFHAKGQPGSHVIVKTNGKELPDSVYAEAAALAAYYSKGRQAPKVEIDYTLKKNLRKPNGSKPGFVVYYTNYSMMAEPNIRNLQEIQD